MPIYEYLCEKCGHEFEREQRITEDPVKTCPKCRAKKVRRLISRTAFVLKGSGWYSDLYSSSKPESGDKQESSDSAASAATPDAKSDAKPEKSDTPKPGGKSKGKGKGKSTKAA
jgi:putative FmdB family regulatory protein